MSGNNGQTDLREYLSILNRRKVFIIIPLMILPLSAFIIGYFMPPVYKSSVTLLIGESKILPPSVESQLGSNRPTYTPFNEPQREQALFGQITSTKYLRRLIAALDMPIPDKVRQVVDNTKSSYPEVSENELAETIMADELRGNIEIDLSSNSLLHISFKAPDPIQAQKRAKTLAEIFIEESLAQELAGVRSNIAFSEEQLDLYRSKLNAAENKLKDFRQQLIVSTAGEDTSGLNLQQIASAAEAIDLEISSLEEKQREYGGILISEGLDTGNIRFPSKLSGEKNQLLSNIERLTELLTKYSWRDPKVLSLNEEAKNTLNDLNDKITSYVDDNYSDKSSSVREVISKYMIGELTVDFSLAKRKTLDQSIVNIKSRLTDNPNSEVTLDRLQSEVDNYKTLYDLFVKHAQYAAIDQSAKKVEAEARYSVIKPASLPLGPESPNKFRLLLMGLALGLVLGTSVIILLEILDNSFRKVDEFESYVGIKVLGTIPRIRLPYGTNLKRKIPYIIGATVSVMLVVWIIFLRSKGN